MHYSVAYTFLITCILFMTSCIPGIISELQSQETEKAYRFITFNNDQSNIRLEMVFAIPFLQIPIGQSSNTGVRPSVDVNLKSLVVAGLVFFVLFFVVPGIIRVTIPNSSISRGWGHSEASRILERMETSLGRYGIDSNACLNEGMCYMMQNAKSNVLKGHGSSWDKIVDGLSSNSWAYTMLPSHLMPNNCPTNYTCPVMEYNFSNLFTTVKQNMKKIKYHLPDFNNINLG